MLRRSLGGLPSLCALASSGAKLLHASPVPAQLPRALPAPVDERRKGPRLGYRRRPLQRCVLMLSLAVLSAAATARAQDAAPVVLVESVIPTRLEYTAAPGCFDEETFHHAVASFMEKGRDPFDASAPVVLRVTFKKVRGGYRGSVQKIPAAGEPWPEEDWTGPTCEGVFREIARLASMSVLGPPKPAQPPPAPAPDTTPPPDPPKPPPDPVPSQVPRVAPASFAQLHFTPPQPPPPPPPMDLTITLSTAFVLTAGFTADVGPAVQLAGGLRYDWFSLDLELRGVFPGRVVASEQLDPNVPRPPRAFDLSQMSAQLVPCARFATYFAGCGVVGAYVQVTQDRTQGNNVFPGWIIGPRFGVEVPFAQRFAVFGFAEALFAPMYSFQEYAVVPEQEDSPGIRWDQSIVSGFFGVGVSVKFK